MNTHSYNRYIPGLLVMTTGLVVLLASGFAFSDFGQLHSLTQSAFRDLCHQFASRSFHIDGTKMAVCSRCFGMYSGMFIMSAAGLLFPKAGNTGIKSALWPAALAILINTVDVAGYAAGFWINSNLSRFCAGLLAGAAAIFIILTALKRKS